MADQEVLSNPDKLKELAKEYKHLEPLVNTGIDYIKILDQIADLELSVSMKSEDNDKLFGSVTKSRIQKKRFSPF